MTLVVVAGLAALTSAGLWRVGRSMFEAPILLRTNYRGAQVPVK